MIDNLRLERYANRNGSGRSDQMLGTVTGKQFTIFFGHSCMSSTESTFNERGIDRMA